MKSSDSPFNSSFKLECEAEEADVKIVRHAIHCCREGYSSVVVKTMDYDVLVLLLHHFGSEKFVIPPQFKLFADLSSNNSSKWYNVMDLCNDNEMGKSLSQGQTKKCKNYKCAKLNIACLQLCKCSYF